MIKAIFKNRPHAQESNIELMLVEEFINRHSINRGFGSGLPSQHNVVQFPSVYVPDVADGIKCEELRSVFMILHGDVSR